MKRIIAVLTLMTLLAVLAVVMMSRTADAAGTTITLLEPPPSGVINLRVGETYTLNFTVASDMPFTSAMVLADQYYPGRGVFYHGADHAGRGTSAALSLSLTGKSPTSDLPGGYAPISAVVAVRYPGLPPVVQRFEFQVFVAP